MKPPPAKPSPRPRAPVRTGATAAAAPSSRRPHALRSALACPPGPAETMAVSVRPFGPRFR